MNISLNLFFYFFCFSFFPAFVLGVSYTNYLIAIFLLVSLIFYFKEIRNIIIENKNFSLSFAIYYLLLLISSTLSDFQFYSFSTSLLYFVYLVYICALIRLFSLDKFQIIFYFSGLIIFLIISLDGFYEIFKHKNIIGNSAIPGRLSGLFGDRWVIGGYLVRLLPILIAIFLFNLNKINLSFKLFSYFVFIISSFIIVFSGERTAYLLFLFYFFLIILFIFKYIDLKFFFLILISLIILFVIPFLNSDHNARLLDKVLFYLTTLNYGENQYLTLYSTAFKVFLNNPFFGSGPNTFRHVCSDEMYYIAYFSCSTHPHNIFLQLLSETGILGTIMIYSFFTFVLIKMFKLLKVLKFDHRVFAQYSLLSAIIMNLLPIVPSGNFFLSWNGFIFMLPLSLYFIYRKYNSYK